MEEPKAESATLVEEEGWLLAEDSPPLVMASSDLELSQNVARLGIWSVHKVLRSHLIWSLLLQTVIKRLRK